MGTNSMLQSPKNEEQLVPDSIIADNNNLSEYKGNLGIKEGGYEGEGVMKSAYDEFNWDHLIEWDEFAMNEEDIKEELCGIWEGDEDEEEEDDDEKRTCLNLSLNYQEVMNAWSDRGPCRAEGFTHSISDNQYMGEVPVMEEAKTKREASVLKYKKKRQNRLFSRKIRYEGRKLNADKRPRLKGRFVKREQ